LNNRVTSEQLALRDTVRQLLARESNTRTAMTSSAGYDQQLWTRLCALGVAGLAIPEEHGGFGASFMETRIVLAELGRTLTPGPFLGSAVVAAEAVLSTGADKAGLLPGIAAGTTIATLVSAPGAYVLDAHVADVFLVVAGDGLYAYAPADVVVTPAGAMDPTRRLATIALTDAPGRFLGVPDLTRVRAVSRAALCAEQAGAAARCLELTVEHTKQRTQFGRAIGSFQALKHRMADLHVLVETAESASLAAAAAVVSGDDLASVAATAKVWCAEAFHTVAGEMIQLHGGIAITWEHDAQLYFKRAHGSTQLFGSPRELVARLADELG
jgi:alkylation response protein AidB-like acyl-CoA dehydrogenase